MRTYTACKAPLEDPTAPVTMVKEFYSLDGRLQDRVLLTIKSTHWCYRKAEAFLRSALAAVARAQGVTLQPHWCQVLLCNITSPEFAEAERLFARAMEA
jgi:hypothetical protein